MASTALIGTRVQLGRKSTVRARTSLVVRASSDSTRRQALGAVLAGVVAIPASAAWAVSPIILADKRKEKSDIADEARDDDLDIRVRRGETQLRESVADTKKRIAESKGRFEREVLTNLKKGYWTASREGLRNQMGYLRYDLRNLAGAAPDKKKAKAENDAFFSTVEKLDYALRQKNMDEAQKQYDMTIQSLGSALAALG